MMKGGLRISYQDRLLLCFLGGILGGTIIANLLSSELQSQIGYFDALLLSGAALSDVDQRRLWGYVTRQRLLETAGVWLVSLTTFASLGCCMLAVLAGAVASVTISVITVQKGLFGILFYLASILPQWLFYIPVFLVLALWAEKNSRVIRIRALLILLFLVLVGAAAEVYINPYIIGILKNM